VFAIAAETGWPEERILFMSLSRLAQYQHCLFRRNGIRTRWSNGTQDETSLKSHLQALRQTWIPDEMPR
jgi:hypothetical protein